MPSQSFVKQQRYFPKEIISITIGYIGSHLMIHRGDHQWNINKELLEEMKNAEIAQNFKSETFSLCKLKWQLHAYPNGDDPGSVGSFNLFLRYCSRTLYTL